MALSPEDLLIFKARAAHKKKKEEKPQVPEAKAAPQQQAKPAPVVQKPVAQQVQAAPKMPVIEEARQVRAAPVEVPTPEEVVPEAGAAPSTKRESESRDLAKGKFCAWHAWRPAFAICGYCHRPFCYEDMEEFNNAYYCLEDIDKVATTHEESVYTSYTNVSFVSAAMLMLAFAIFMVFANGQLAFVLSLAHVEGASFLINLNYSYGSLLLEMLLVLVSLGAAVMIVAQTKRAFGLGMVAGMGNIALFSYQYLGSGTIYMAAIAAASFVGMVTLAYSRVSYKAYAETPYLDGGAVAATATPQGF